MSATYAGVTPNLPSCNPNASRTDERPVQLTQMDGHMTRTDGHVDNPICQWFEPNGIDLHSFCFRVLDCMGICG